MHSEKLGGRHCLYRTAWLSGGEWCTLVLPCSTLIAFANAFHYCGVLYKLHDAVITPSARIAECDSAGGAASDLNTLWFLQSGSPELVGDGWSDAQQVQLCDKLMTLIELLNAEHHANYSVFPSCQGDTG